MYEMVGIDYFSHDVWMVIVSTHFDFFLSATMLTSAAMAPVEIFFCSFAIRYRTKL